MYWQYLKILIAILLTTGCSTTNDRKDWTTEKYYRIYGDCYGDSIDIKIRDEILAKGWMIPKPYDSSSYPKITYRKYYTDEFGEDKLLNWRLEWVHHRWLEVNVAWSESEFRSVTNGVDTKFDSIYWEVRSILEKYCSLEDSLIIKHYPPVYPLK
ncbi:MAG: hypothetical protein ACE364_07160 [Chlorobiota bacterium]